MARRSCLAKARRRKGQVHRPGGGVDRAQPVLPAPASHQPGATAVGRLVRGCSGLCVTLGAQCKVKRFGGGSQGSTRSLLWQSPGCLSPERPRASSERHSVSTGWFSWGTSGPLHLSSLGRAGWGFGHHRWPPLTPSDHPRVSPRVSPISAGNVVGSGKMRLAV